MEAQRQTKLIYQLEKEREKYSIEASEAAAKYMAALEEVCDAWMYGVGSVGCRAGDWTRVKHCASTLSTG
jgi:hypothetical protein